MNDNIHILKCDTCEICVPTKDIILYSGCRQSTDEMLCSLSEEALKELREAVNLKAVYTKVSVEFDGDLADFGFCKHESASIRKFLGGDCEAYIFAATLGIGADRLIARYSSILPSRAVITDGCATAFIECWCDYICKEIFRTQAQARFSPGYGDLPLSMQTDLLTHLNASLHIGLAMTDSFLLTPTKSVTAIVKVPDGQKD